MHKVFLAAAASVVLASPASAAVVYSNNFDAENGGNTFLNYNGFNGLTVTDGTVDLVKSGDFGIICPGGAGACVDLDGSTNNSGLTSSGSYAFGAGQKVALSFLFSGNQRGGADDTFRVLFNLSGINTGTFGFESTFYGSDINAFNSNFLGYLITGVNSGFGPTDFTLFFTADNAGAATFTFEDLGNDNIGVVVDNVSLAVVPEPSAWALMIIGFGAVGAMARRRRAARTALG